MTLPKEFFDLADDAMERIGPGLAALVNSTTQLDGAKIVGATVTLQAQDAQGLKYVRAAVNGCTCIGCLEGAVRALCAEYGFSLKELITEAKPQTFAPITAVH